MQASRLAILPVLAATAAAAGQVAPPIVFEDVSAERGLLPYQMAVGMGGGAAAADFDGDGHVDVFVPTALGAADQLYRNLGNGHFEEIAAEAGVASVEKHRVALWLDYDGDGMLDLLVAGDREEAATPYVLYRQHDPGIFQDATEAAGLAVPVPPRIDTAIAPHRGGLCAGDLNGDGWLDIYSAQWNGDPHLFMSEGGGTYTEVAAEAGVTGALHYGHQPMMADFNGDARLDIYAAIDFLWNALWINEGEGTFTDVAAMVGADNAMNDMGMTLGDVDNDGDLDVYITNIAVLDDSWNILLEYEPGLDWHFREIARDLEVDQGGWGWGTTFLDADNDGWLDIAATNGWFTPMFEHDPSRFFWNRMGAGGGFQEVSGAVQFDDTFWGSCIVAFDADRDGDLDLLQTCHAPGPLRLLENRPAGDGGAGGSIVIRPRTSAPNRFAIGATVLASAGGLEQMRLITAGTSYLGQEPAEAFFGIGDAASAAEIVVHWPQGGRTCLRDVPAGTVAEVMRPSLQAGPADLTDDGRVDRDDLVALLSAWGACPSWPEACLPDIDGDCAVTVGDLIDLMLAWDAA